MSFVQPDCCSCHGDCHLLHMKRRQAVRMTELLVEQNEQKVAVLDIMKEEQSQMETISLLLKRTRSIMERCLISKDLENGRTIAEQVLVLAKKVLDIEKTVEHMVRLGESIVEVEKLLLEGSEVEVELGANCVLESVLRTKKEMRIEDVAPLVLAVVEGARRPSLVEEVMEVVVEEGMELNELPATLREQVLKMLLMNPVYPGLFYNKISLVTCLVMLFL